MTGQLRVVGAGPPTREGGIDLYLELVRAVAAARPAEFVWIGARPRVAARLLDAEIRALDLWDAVDWLPRGGDPSRPGTVHVVTARSVAAARESLAEVTAGVPAVGLAADPAVLEVLESGGVHTVRYPDVSSLLGCVLDAASDPGGQSSST